MLRKYPNLWCDLAFRNEHGTAGKVPAEWRAVFTEFPDRFMVGTDTFTPERWHYVVEHAQWSRAWLADLPPALALRLALARAERGDSVEALFRGRYFPAEEGGTTPERVLVAARSLGARAAADAHRCDAALTMVDGVSRADPAMPFSSEALEAAASDPWTQLQLARVEAACGRADAARGRWTRLSEARRNASPVATAIAYEAATSLGTAGDAASPARLEAALGAITAVVESEDADSPGTALYVQARLLAALGRVDEARVSLARVFLFPDRNLSHALARRFELDLMEPSK
jgi:hypothetical protein